MHVCPFNIHAGFSVLYSSSTSAKSFQLVCFFLSSGTLSVCFSSLAASTKDVLPWFHPQCDALQSSTVGSTHSSVSEWDVFLAFADAGILQLSLPFLACSLVAPLLYIAVLWHQFLSISPAVAWSLSQSGPTYTVARYYQQKRASVSQSGSCFCSWCSTHLSLLAYECCRVKSKSFSRFLLCSLLQTSSSCFPSSPSSSWRCWVLVGCGEQACTTNCKSRFLSSLQKICIPQKLCLFLLLVITEVHLFTHAGAGSEWPGHILALMVGVTADSRHFHPHWLIWGSKRKHCSVC